MLGMSERFEEESALENNHMAKKKLFPRRERADIVSPSKRGWNWGRVWEQLAEAVWNHQFIGFCGIVSRNGIQREKRNVACRCVRESPDRMSGTTPRFLGRMDIEGDPVNRDKVERSRRRSVESVPVITESRGCREPPPNSSVKL
jgi:hypothetical protein